MDQGDDRRKKKRAPKLVPRKTGVAGQQKTAHEVRKEALEAKERFIAAPTQRGWRQAFISPAGGGQGAGGSGSAKYLHAAHEAKERTGFDVLQHTYDKDTYPTTLPEAGAEEEGSMQAGHIDVTHEEFDAEDKKVVIKKQRRYCEIGTLPSRHKVFCHKARPSKADPGKSVVLTECVCAMVSGGKSVELKVGSEVITLFAETGEEAQAWFKALTDAQEESKDDLQFAAYLERTYGVGLDFLAEVEKEERLRTKNNKALFADGSETGDGLQENEVFLIQLPHMLPSAVVIDKAGQSRAQANRQQQQKQQGQTIAHKPGTGWTGRALGSAEHISSLSTIPPGKIGKIQVHKSGKVKMKIGDCVFDISSGGEASYAQTLMGIYLVDKKYKAQGWGPTGCTIYSEPSIQKPTQHRKLDGDVIVVLKETQNKEGSFMYFTENGGDSGWVIREGSSGGKWLSADAGDQRARAYELGQITKKLVVTPDFDYFDET